MKLIIDIPDEEYKMRVLWAKSDNLCSPDTIWIARGLPYEERTQGGLISRDALKEVIAEKATFIDGDSVYKIIDLINNAPAVDSRIEYGTDGQPYRLFMSGGQVVPDTLQGWRYEADIKENNNADNH